MRARLLPFLALALFACDRGGETVKAPGPDQAAKPGPRAAQDQPAGRLDRSHAGTPAPAGAFEDPQGRSVSLSDFRGRPLLVNLWATWCAPCVTEMPNLDSLAERNEVRLQVLAISQDGDERTKVESFLAEHKLAALEPYMDPKLALMPELGVDILPTTILYDAEGRELWRMTGMADWSSRANAELIAEAFSPAAAR